MSRPGLFYKIFYLYIVEIKFLNRQNICIKNVLYLMYSIITPKGIRIPVCSVKGSCPRPLDDGGN